MEGAHCPIMYVGFQQSKRHRADGDDFLVSLCLNNLQRFNT